MQICEKWVRDDVSFQWLIHRDTRVTSLRRRSGWLRFFRRTHLVGIPLSGFSLAFLHVTWHFTTYSCRSSERTREFPFSPRFFRAEKEKNKRNHERDLLIDKRGSVWPDYLGVGSIYSPIRCFINFMAWIAMRFDEIAIGSIVGILSDNAMPCAKWQS